ncbi:MAG: hypothetical protein K2X03_07400 [Bryobacteraceae bacterium]|nr:hypothetical protein [Bryobacteraceae bacterium]
MRTVVSLPDRLFTQAEGEAKRLGISRGRLYALALEEFFERREASITERLNEVYSQTLSCMDPALLRAQMLSMGRGEW